MSTPRNLKNKQKQLNALRKTILSCPPTTATTCHLFEIETIRAVLKENKPFHNNFDQRPLEPPPMFNNMGGRMDGPPRGPHINVGPPHANGPPTPRWGRPNDRDRDEFGPKRRRF